MKKIVVPILTEEYKIVIVIGKKNELVKAILDECEGWTIEEARNQVEKTRGSAFDRSLDGLHPLITIDGDQDWHQAIATLAHEAYHAMTYIVNFINIEDSSGEFVAHGISSVMRHTLKIFKPKK